LRLSSCILPSQAVFILRVEHAYPRRAFIIPVPTDKLGARSVFSAIRCIHYEGVRPSKEGVWTMFFEAAAKWVWEVVGKDFLKKLEAQALVKWKQFNWKRAASAYRDHIVDLYGTTWVLGKSEPISLEGIYTDLYALDEITATKRFDIALLMRLQKERDHLDDRGDRLDAIRALDRQKRLFILGKPGAGKTTFLKHVTLKAASGQVHGRHTDGSVDPLTPIFITLKDWADSGLTLPEFIDQVFEVCQFPEPRAFIQHLLNTGRAILLFDGLDEVDVEGGPRDRLTREIRNFTIRYRECKFAITCRIAAVEYEFDRFKYVEIADFTKSQVSRYVSKWFTGRKRQLGERFLKELDQQENRGIRELANIPIILSLLCLAYEETLMFPRRRIDIYEHALDALLRRWDASRGIARSASPGGDEVYRSLALGRKHQMFASIACATFEKDEIFLRRDAIADCIARYLRNVPRLDPRKEIDGVAVLKAIEARHGILVERALGVYSFSHLTFQEYYTAKYIVDTRDGGSLEKLAHRFLPDDRWHEVFLLASSLLPEADGFIRALLDSAWTLIKDDPTLVRVVRLGEKKGDSNYRGDRLGGRREALAYVLHRARNRKESRSEARLRAIKRARALDPVLVRGLDQDLVRAVRFDLDRVRALALSLASIPTRDGDLELELDGELEHVLDYARALAFVHSVDSIRGVFRDLDTDDLSGEARAFSELAVELSALHVPGENALSVLWIKFVSQLQDIMVRHRCSGQDGWLDGSQIDRLSSYFRASIRAHECLEVAYVSEREWLEDRILRVPTDISDAA
jgi:hypothetical protein